MKHTDPKSLAEMGWKLVGKEGDGAAGLSGDGTPDSEAGPPTEEGVLVGNVRLVPVARASQGKVVISVRNAENAEIFRDRVDPNSSRSRTMFAGVVCNKTSQPPDQRAVIADAVMRLPEVEEHEGASDKNPAAALATRDDQTESILDATPPDILEEAERYLNDPRLAELIVADIAATGVVGEVDLAVTVYLQGCSRLLASPLSVRVQGTSSSGKSYVIEKVAGLFPTEHLLKATDITPNALYYLRYGTLMHTFVVAGERSRVENDEKAEAKRALREMISAKELHKAITLKMIDGSMEAVIIHQPGPIAFIESTTGTRIFDEDENRCLQLSTDESPEQTERIVLAAARAAASARNDVSRIVLRHQTLQRQLRRVRVLVPFAEAIARAMPKTRPEARRAIGLALAMVQAVALLYQRQRGGDGLRHGDEIRADLQDYVVARKVLSGPLARALGGALLPAVANFGHRLIEHFAEGQVFSRRDVDDGIVTATSKVNQYLGTLAEYKVVECVEPGRGQKPATWRVIGEVPDSGAIWLPTVAQIKEAM